MKNIELSMQWRKKQLLLFHAKGTIEIEDGKPSSFSFAVAPSTYRTNHIEMSYALIPAVDHAEKLIHNAKPHQY